MRLPQIEEIVVSRRKIQHYLLSDTHPCGRFKASFFSRFGFHVMHWDVLADALKRHAREYDIIKSEENQFGIRYTIEGKLNCPDGRRPWVRSVWFIEQGKTEPVLVTAYPISRYGDD